MSRPDEDQINRLVNELVDTRFPYEVGAILEKITHHNDRTTIVSAALYRSLQKGRTLALKEERDRIRRVMGL